MLTTMTVKGQVTIPKAVRERAGLRPGMRVLVANDADGRVLIEAVAVDEAERLRLEGEARVAAFDAAMEKMKDFPIRLGMTADEFMATLREPIPL